MRVAAAQWDGVIDATVLDHVVDATAPSKLAILIDHISPLFVPMNSSTMLWSGTVVVA